MHHAILQMTVFEMKVFQKIHLKSYTKRNIMFSLMFEREFQRIVCTFRVILSKWFKSRFSSLLQNELLLHQDKSEFFTSHADFNRYRLIVLEWSDFDILYNICTLYLFEFFKQLRAYFCNNFNFSNLTFVINHYFKIDRFACEEGNLQEFRGYWTRPKADT